MSLLRVGKTKKRPVHNRTQPAMTVVAKRARACKRTPAAEQARSLSARALTFFLHVPHLARTFLPPSFEFVFSVRKKPFIAEKERRRKCDRKTSVRGNLSAVALRRWRTRPCWCRYAALRSWQGFESSQALAQQLPSLSLSLARTVALSSAVFSAKADGFEPTNGLRSCHFSGLLSRHCRVPAVHFPQAASAWHRLRK